MASKIIQYIIVNGEITNALRWPLGRVIAQCCHATAAVNQLYCDDIDTRRYFRDLDDMPKALVQVTSKTRSSHINVSHTELISFIDQR